ncbi:MAG: hypothetical protein QM759_14885 [Terricaulis sp.]
MRALMFAVFALAACASAPVDQPAADASQNSAPRAARINADTARLESELHASGVVAVGLGETADLGGGLTVKPLEVLEDSRCPQDVTCVWGGRLRLRAEVSGAAQEFTLGQPLETAQGVVTLAVVSPGAWSQWPNSKPPYRFGFRRG